MAGVAETLPKEGWCPADKRGRWDELGGENAKQEGMNQQTLPGSPQYPSDPSPWAHSDPQACPCPPSAQGPAEAAGQGSRAAAGARGCSDSHGLKANAQIMRLFGKKPICII